MLRELTFYCHRHLTIPQARQLRKLAGLFRSKLLLVNLTRRQQADPEQLLALLTVAASHGDLCQLVIEGLDAELAHMVFTSWVTDLGHQLGQRRADFTPTLVRLARFQPDICFTPAMLRISRESLDKASALSSLVALLPDSAQRDPDALLAALNAREAIASTMMRTGLAMPHAVSESVRQPALALLWSAQEIEWGSALGSAQLLLLMVAPKGNRECLKPLARLVQSLLDPCISDALLRASSDSARHAIVAEALIHPAGSMPGTDSASPPSSV